MKRFEIAYVVVGSAVVACGCMNFNLLEEMESWDTDPAHASPVSEDADEAVGDGGGVEVLPERDDDDTEGPVVSAVCGMEEASVGDACWIAGAMSGVLRFETDEPARIDEQVPESVRYRLLSAEWAEEHWVLVAPIPEEGATLVLELSDVNGNATEYSVDVAGDAGPTVSITEVLADPVGPEPAQEFVEVVNFGSTPVDISGWMIDDNDDADGDIIPDGTVLAPMSVYVMVPSSFVDDTGGAILIRLDNSIGSNGLKNSESEVVVLYDAHGVPVSRFETALAPKEGVGIQRPVAQIPDGLPITWEYHPTGGNTPGVCDIL